jgi:hypothetical protein
MALTHSQAPKLGSVAPDFSLLGVDNEGREKNYSLESFASVKALVIVFYCNHCPYVIAVQKRVNDLRSLRSIRTTRFVIRMTAFLR